MSLKSFTSSATRRFSVTSCGLAVCLFVAFFVGSSHAETLIYTGEVTGGDGTLVALVPAGTAINGDIDVSDPALAAGLIGINDITDIGVKVGGFCFTFGAGTCVGTVVPITSIDFAAITGTSGVLSGLFDVTAFSPTFMIDIPISFDLDAGAFSASTATLGSLIGTGMLEAPSVPLPEISTQPANGATIDFGTVVVGDSVADEQIIISSIGGLDLNVASVALSGMATNLSLTSNCVGAIAIGTDCTETLSLATTSAATINATVTILSDATNLAPLSTESEAARASSAGVPFGGGGSASSTFTVLATIVEPAALTSDASTGDPLLLTSVAVGAVSNGLITVTNTGGVSVTLGTVAVPAMPFALTANDNCSGETLVGGDDCTIEVEFAPTVAGTFASDFVLQSADMSLSTTLSVMSSTLDPVASADPLTIVDTMVNNTNTGTITVTNSGEADLVITDATGLTAPFSSDVSACTAAPVAPTDSCDIVVTFAPTEEVTSMGSLTVVSNDPAMPPLSVMVTGTGTEQLLPNIMVTPATLIFATPLLIGEMAMDTITVSNMGTADLTISAIALDPDPSADFAIAHDCVSPLIPMGTCTITVTFAPTAGGPLSTSVTIDSDDADTPLATVDVSGTGVVPEADIMLSATSLDLGVVTLGSSATDTVTVSNVGTAALDITSVTLPAGDYSQTNDCTAMSLQPMTTCTVTITFEPSVAETVVDTLTIMSTDLDTMVSTVALTGRGVDAPEANIASNVDELVFGNGLFGDTIDRSVVIENSGSAVLTISGLTITGTDAAEFTVTSDCVGALAIGADCTATVQFAPGAPEGVKSASLFVASDDADTPNLEVTLGGSSEMPVPEAMFSATALAFADTVTGETSTQMLTITNNGTGELTVSAVALQGATDPAFTLDSETCTAAPVAVNGTCDVTVSFTPSDEGDVSGELGVSTDDPAATATTIELTGSGLALPAPDIAADVTSLTFGSVQFGDTGQLSLTVTNMGDADLTISGATIAPAGDFTATTLCGVLTPSASCTVDVTYAPTVEGDVAATLSVASDDADTPSLDISLTGTGVPLEPEIELSATELMFGSIVVGTTETMTLTVSNSGMADLTIGSVVISGTDQASFSQTNDCTTVATSSNCTVTVTFEPAVVGDASALLTIVSDDADEGSVEVTLAGMATPVPMPMISVNPALDIGEVTAGETGAGTITVSNAGTADLQVTDVAIAGANASDFTQTNACATIVAGGTCDITLEFTPSTDGAATADVVITSNDSTSPTTVVVSATALVPVPMASTQILDLGGVRIGESGNATVTITNSGSADLVVLSAVLTGMDAADFTLTNACTTVVAGSTCSITADFTPTSEGLKMAAITVTTNDPVLSTFDIAVSATGAPMEEVVVSVNSTGGNGSFGLLDLSLLGLLVALARRFSCRAALLTLAAVGTPLTFADNHEGVNSEGYWYAGAGFGSSDGQADLGSIERGIEEAGVTVTSLNIDDTDSGYKLFAGYQATEHLAVEVGYVDLGEAGIDLQLGDVALEELPLISRSVSGNLSLLGSGVFGAVVAKQTFGERYGLFAKVGLVSWEIDTAIGGGTSAGALNIQETESGTDFLFGVGAEAWFGEAHKFGVRGEWERFELGEQDAEFLSLGVMYRF